MNSIRNALFFMLLTVLICPMASNAQIFTPIVGDYSCGQFPNGAQFLVKQTSTGFILVKSSVVKETFNKERRIIKQRISTLNDLLKDFKKARISRSQLIGSINKLLAKLLGLTAIPKNLPPSEAEIAINNFKQKLLDRDGTLKTIGDLINNCESGINPKQGRGTAIGVSIVPISAVSSNTIYGGFAIYAPKMKNEFSKKPTGYNVCLKLIYPDGTVGKLYTGFGDEDVCGTGTSKFEGVAPNVCDAFIPAKQAGYVIQKRTYAFTSLPDATTAQLLDRMRLEVIQDEPLVGVLVFPVTLSRDSAVKACEAF